MCVIVSVCPTGQRSQLRRQLSLDDVIMMQPTCYNRPAYHRPSPCCKRKSKTAVLLLLLQNTVPNKAVPSHFAKTKTKLSFAFAFAKYRP
jgi:hypothetical protein